MRFLGCLGSLLLFFFLIGVVALGSFLYSVHRLFGNVRGAQQQGAQQPQGGTQQPQGTDTQQPDEGDYHFQPGDGEYIDFEEVKSERQGDE